MADSTGNAEDLDIFAAVCEDLAVELLMNLSADEMPKIASQVAHLTRASEIFDRFSIDTPFPVRELLRHYEASKRSSLTSGQN